MSAESEVVTRRHFEYLAQRTRGDDEFLQQLKEAALAEQIPPIWISPEQASFLQILLKAAAAREVVEVGTLAGYSAIVLARALPPGGRVRTIELDPRHADFAERWIARSDVADRVEVLRGSGMDVLPGLGDAVADAIFLDADKRSYPRYLEQGLRVVRSGGLILADNAFAFGQLFDPQPTDPETVAIREFNEVIAATTELHSVIVPFGDGCWVGVRS